MVSTLLSDDFLKLVSRWRFRWSRGIQWTTIPMTLFSVVSMAIIWTPILNQFGIPLWVFIIVAATGFLGTTILVGYFDDRYKMIKRETEHFNVGSNPYDGPLKKLFEESEKNTREIQEIKQMIDDSFGCGLKYK